MDNAPLAIAWYVVFIVSTTLHEAAHGVAAKILGDPTAYQQGLATLDPLPHIKRSPFGMVIIPILSFLLNGWMIGWASAPYDPYWSAQHRRKAALMSLAGPAANLTLVLIAALAVRIGIALGSFQIPDIINFTRVTEATSPGLANSTAVMISILFSLNLILLVFNLIPLPPLDGSNILLLLLSDRAAQRYQSLLYHPTYMMIGLIVAWQFFGPLFGPIHTLALNLLYPGAGYH